MAKGIIFWDDEERGKQLLFHNDMIAFTTGCCCLGIASCCSAEGAPPPDAAVVTIVAVEDDGGLGDCSCDYLNGGYGLELTYADADCCDYEGIFDPTPWCTARCDAGLKIELTICRSNASAAVRVWCRRTFPEVSFIVAEFGGEGDIRQWPCPVGINAPQKGTSGWCACEYLGIPCGYATVIV